MLLLLLLALLRRPGTCDVATPALAGVALG